MMGGWVKKSRGYTAEKRKKKWTTRDGLLGLCCPGVVGRGLCGYLEAGGYRERQEEVVEG